jgi:hypothetical protein
MQRAYQCCVVRFSGKEGVMERCNELCTKQEMGVCALCDVLEERDRFVYIWLGGWLWTMLKTWAHNLLVDLIGPYGYRVWIVSMTTFIGAYFGLYAVMEARYERRANRAAFERSSFIDLVTSGNRGAFIAAMKNFGPIQIMTVPREPSLLKPWGWWKTETPNQEPLSRWAQNFLPLCTPLECGYSNKEYANSTNKEFRIDLFGAKLSSTELSEARLSEADLARSDLSGANLIRADLRGARLRGASLSLAYLIEADLSGADLSSDDVRRGDDTGFWPTPGGGLLGFAISHVGPRPTNMYEADLSGANLNAANLAGANVEGADLAGADLRGADLRWTYGTPKNLNAACIDNTTAFSIMLERPSKLPTDACQHKK